jgi:hypothetical protein
MVDIFGSVALMCGLGFSGFVHWQTAIGMLIAFLLLSSESYLATYTLSHFQLSQGVFGPTEIRILLILGNLALLRSPYSTIFGRLATTCMPRPQPSSSHYCTTLCGICAIRGETAMTARHDFVNSCGSISPMVWSRCWETSP